MTVTLGSTVVGGGATRYTVDWGDGTTETVSATNPTHDYDENSGTPYTIAVKAESRYLKISEVLSLRGM